MKKVSELINRQIVMFNESDEVLPSVSELPDGEYNALFYGWVLELEDGRKYATDFGVRRGRRHTSLQKYRIRDGKLDTSAI